MNKITIIISSCIAALVLGVVGYFAVFQESKLTIDIPDEISVDRCKPAGIEVKTSAKAVLWISLNDKLQTLQYNNGKLLIVSSPTEGTYKILAIISSGGNLLQKTVTVKVGSLPFPPNPPDPPIPPPIPPEPTDPFYVKLKEAFAKETDKSNKALIAQMYSRFASDVVSDTSLVNVGQLFSVLSKTGQDVLKDSLKNVRLVISAELGGNFPTDPDVVLDAILREKLKVKFLQIADFINKVK